MLHLPGGFNSRSSSRGVSIATRPTASPAQAFQQGDGQVATTAKPASGGASWASVNGPPRPHATRNGMTMRTSTLGEEVDDDYASSSEYEDADEQLGPEPFRVSSDILLDGKLRSTSRIPLPPIPGASKLSLSSGIQTLQQNWKSQQAKNASEATGDAKQARNGSRDTTSSRPASSMSAGIGNSHSVKKRSASGQDGHGTVKRQAIGDMWSSFGSEDVPPASKQGLLSEEDLAKVIDSAIDDERWMRESSTAQPPRRSYRPIRPRPGMLDEQGDIEYDNAGRVLYDNPKEQKMSYGRISDGNTSDSDTTDSDTDSSIDEIPARIDRRADHPISAARKPAIVKNDSPEPLASSRSGRSYKVVALDDCGPESSRGALIPDGYRKYPDDGNPWICPIRSCRKLFRNLTALGGHFSSGHREQLLNDNGDGTFSVVGKYSKPNENGRTPAIVISRGSPDPDEPPMAKPMPPDYRRPLGSDARRESLAMMATPPTQRRRQTERYRGVFSRQPDMSTSTRSKLRYIMPGHAPKSAVRAYLERMFAGNPHFKWDLVYKEETQPLLELPRKRDLPEAWMKKWGVGSRMNKAAFLGLVLYLVGDEAETPCLGCHEPEPFEVCVVANDSVSDEVKQYLGGACAVCQFKYMMWHQRNCCSFREQDTRGFVGLGHAQETFPASETPADIDLTASGVHDTQFEYMEWDGQDSAEDSAGAPFLDTLEPGHDISVVGGVEGAPHSRRRARRSQPRPGSFYKLKPSRGPNQQSTAMGGLPFNDDDAVLMSRGQIMSADALEMEDWEVAPGRIEESGDEGDNVAFSNAYLSASQAIPVTQDVGFNVIVLRPGQQNRWDPDRDNVRICSLATGKLKVKMDSGLEFQVGPNGMFKIKPGMSCLVTNRLYIDAVVHVTTVREL